MNPLGLAVGKKVAVALGVLGIAAAGVATNLSGAAASTSYSMAPSGPSAFGSGTVGIGYNSGGLVVSIDLVGARGSTLFRLSACAAGPSQCTSDPTNDLVMTTTTGELHGSFQVPTPVRTDVVTLVDQRDANDSYQAAVSAGNQANSSSYAQPVGTSTTWPFYAPGFPYVGNPFFRYPWVVGTGNNMIFVPIGTPLVAGNVCPAGFHGPLVVTVGGYGFPYNTLFGWPFNGLPANAFTMTVNC